MSTYTRVAALAAAGLLLAACDITISPDRLEVGGEGTITVSPDTAGSYPPCADGATVDVYVTDADGANAALAGSTTSVGGDWSLDITPPADLGSYQVYASCERNQDGVPVSVPSEGQPEELVVEPPFAPTVDPTAYAVDAAPATIAVTGSFCINSGAVGEEAPAAPEVTGTLGAAEETATASESQPFEETWTLTFDAPTAPGTHVVDLTCDYTDVDSATSTPVPTAATKTTQVEVVVSGAMEASATSIDEGDPLTIENAASSPCLGGSVTVIASDGETEVATVEAVVAGDGTWSADLSDLPPGEFTIAADCTDGEFGSFPYAVLSATVVPTPEATTTSTTMPTTTTTTATTTRPAPGGGVSAQSAQSAQPVVVQPGYTG